MSLLANKTFDGCPGGPHRLVAAVPGRHHRTAGGGYARTIDTTPAPWNSCPIRRLSDEPFERDRLPHPPMRPEPDGLRPAPCATTPHTRQAESAICAAGYLGIARTPSHCVTGGDRDCSSRICRSARAPAGGASQVLTGNRRCGGLDLRLGVRDDRTDPRRPGEAAARDRHDSGCSTTAFAAPDRRVIESQSVRLSANFLRPERRSTDGQVILKAIPD